MADSKGGKCRTCENWEATSFDQKGIPMNTWATCKVKGERTNIMSNCESFTCRFTCDTCSVKVMCDRVQ